MKKKKTFRLSRWRKYIWYRRKKDIIKPYIIYRNSHDFLKPIKKRIRHWRITRQSHHALRLLAMIDLQQKRHGWSRQKRRRFWRAFFKHSEFRADLYKLMDE